MSYIERNLEWDEKIILNAQVCIAEYIRFFAVCITAYVSNALLITCIFGYLGTDAGAGYFIPPVILMYIGLFNISNIELALTDKKIIGKYGVVKIKKINMPIEYVTEVSVEQNWFEKKFGYGTIIISTLSGNYNFDYIKSAYSFKSAVMEQLDIAEEEKLRKQAEQLAGAMK